MVQQNRELLVFGEHVTSVEHTADRVLLSPGFVPNRTLDRRLHAHAKWCRQGQVSRICSRAKSYHWRGLGVQLVFCWVSDRATKTMRIIFLRISRLLFLSLLLRATTVLTDLTEVLIEPQHRNLLNICSVICAFVAAFGALQSIVGKLMSGKK